MEYCYHLGDCDEDRCDCEGFLQYEQEEKEKKQEKYWWIAIGLAGGYFVVRIIISLIWHI